VFREKSCEDRKDAAGWRRVDVVIVGGGPAGTATGLALARAGYAVTLLERSRYDLPRIGETLPPEVRGPLTELGVWDCFLASGHLESPGIAAAWGRPELYENDFIVNPHGPGWHVDRSRFDAMLARAAADAGAEVLTDARLGACVPGGSAGWCVEAVVNGMRLERQSPMLVDATGRSSSMARRFGGRRIVHNRLVGLVGLFRPMLADGAGHDRRTVVEAVEAGWWYTAPLPDGRRIATFLTDADLLPAGCDARARFWSEQLGRAPHTRNRLGGRTPNLGLRVVAACSARLDTAAIPGLLAVGDAALSFDPLSSQGVTWALESGLAAARALDAHHRGDERALDQYVQWVEGEFADYLRTRAEYYGRERRWPHSPFWRRRHA